MTTTSTLTDDQRAAYEHGSRGERLPPHLERSSDPEVKALYRDGLKDGGHPEPKPEQSKGRSPASRHRSVPTPQTDLPSTGPGLATNLARLLWWVVGLSFAYLLLMHASAAATATNGLTRALKWLIAPTPI